MAAPVALRTRNVRVAHAPVGSCVSGLVCAWLLIKHTRRAKAKTTPHTQLDHSVFLRVKKVESSSYSDSFSSSGCLRAPPQQYDPLLAVRADGGVV